MAGDTDIWNNLSTHRTEILAVQILRSRRGTGLVDVMLSIFLLSVIGLIFSACFPAAVSCSKQA